MFLKCCLATTITNVTLKIGIKTERRERKRERETERVLRLDVNLLLVSTWLN